MSRNVERHGDYWAWTDCGRSNLLSVEEVESALIAALCSFIPATVEDLAESLDEINLSVALYEVDVTNEYEDLKDSIQDVIDEHEKRCSLEVNSN